MAACVHVHLLLPLLLLQQQQPLRAATAGMPVPAPLPLSLPLLAPLAPQFLRVSGSDVHPATATSATQFALDPDNGCSFTWAHRRAPRATAQLAYRVTVRDAATGTDAYDSGRQNTSEPSHRLASGRLAPSRGYLWRVAWWDAGGRQSLPSDEAAFHIAPRDADWAGV